MQDNEKEGKATDCLLNYEAVKLFGNEGFELTGCALQLRWAVHHLPLIRMLPRLAALADAQHFRPCPYRYARAIDAFQAQEYLQLACISLLNIAQSALVFVGLALGLVVCVRGIVAGQLTVGDAVLFLSLMAQLVAPLSFFGSYYRQVMGGRGVDLPAGSVRDGWLPARPARCSIPAPPPHPTTPSPPHPAPFPLMLYKRSRKALLPPLVLPSRSRRA
jgi:ABC-type multidrug transport system fused ATPase/permease subunit